MASYEVEHNVPKPSTTEPSHPPRRPDLSTFFSTLEQVDTSNVSNGNALPVPGDVSAAYRTLAEAFERMRPYRDGEGPLDGMIELLVANSQAPPKEVKGVSQGFLDELERVPNKLLKPSMDCPICGNPFLDDEYPLVVRLPCNKNHMFDLECIAPWLKLHATCPLDRKDLVKEKEPPPPPKDEEEDGEWDDITDLEIQTNISESSTQSSTHFTHRYKESHKRRSNSPTIPRSYPTLPTMSPQSPFPTIDISPFLHPSPPWRLHSTCALLSAACAHPGFFYLANHNLPRALTDRVLALAREFFLDAPAAEKERIKRRDVGQGGNGGRGDGARGYQVIGDNVTGGKRDWHEAIDWYRPVREGEPFDEEEEEEEEEEECCAGGGGGGKGKGKGKTGSSKSGGGDRQGPPYELLKGVNAWPRYPEGFREAYEEYVDKMSELGTAVVRAMGLALGHGMDDVFVGNTRKSAWVMRAIGYPPLPGDGRAAGEDGGGVVSCGAHSDYGCVTLLLADETKGALQAWVETEGEEGRWVDVDPVEGALVVNVGDMMSRWSGGKWKATRHRVVHKGGGYRVSVPFFFEPDWDARVPGKEGEGDVIYGEYLEGKVKGNF